MKRERRIQFNIRLPISQAEQLKALATINRLSQSELVMRLAQPHIEQLNTLEVKR